MADYYPLLLRSLENVANPRPETRRKVYERARSALIAQLRSLNPPLSESDILRECLALDEAVQAIENLYQPPQDSEPSVYTPASQDSRGGGSDYYMDHDQPQRFLRSADQQDGDYYSQPYQELSNTTYAAEQDNHYTSAYQSPGYQQLPNHSEPSSDNSVYSEDTYQEPYSYPSDPDSQIPYLPVQHDAEEHYEDSFGETHTESRDYRPRVMIQPPEEEVANKKRRRVVLGAVLLLIFIIAMLALFLKFRDSRTEVNGTPSVISEQGGTIVVSPGGKNASHSNAAKIPDRVDGDETNDDSQEGTVVGQRAFLSEEVLLEPPHDKKRTVGDIIWKLETLTDQEGKTEHFIHGRATFPDAHFVMDLKIRKNQDPTWSASNTILFQFSNSSSQVSKVVADILDFRAMADPNQADKPLEGAKNQLEQNTFVFAMQKTDTISLEMLRQLPWLRIVFIYDTNQRAAIYFEKGPEGRRIFEEAFRIWEQ